MEITANMNGRTAEVGIKGEMNIYHAQNGKEELMRHIAEADAVELDLSGVTEFDSSGLQILLLAHREMDRNGKELRVKAKSGAVENVIGLFNLGELFERTAPREA